MEAETVWVAGPPAQQYVQEEVVFTQEGGSQGLEGAALGGAGVALQEAHLGGGGGQEEDREDREDRRT